MENGAILQKALEMTGQPTASLRLTDFQVGQQLASQLETGHENPGQSLDSQPQLVENNAANQRTLFLLKYALEAAQHGIMITDQAGRLMLKNQVLLRLFDLPDQTVAENERGWIDIFAGQVKDPDRMMRFLRQILEEKLGETLDILELKSGRTLECRTRYQNIAPLDDSFRLWSFLDCTEQYRREAELQHLSMHDTLTGVYNRAYFDMKLSIFRQTGQFPVIMMMLDVDGLKKVNDQQGHLAGDELLCQAAKILRQACRRDDVTARLGGDEFGLLLARANVDAAEHVADRIHGLLNLHNIRQPDAPISLSLGYAVANNAFEMDDLVARADEMMYENRRKNRGERK